MGIFIYNPHTKSKVWDPTYFCKLSGIAPKVKYMRTSKLFSELKQNSQYDCSATVINDSTGSENSAKKIVKTSKTSFFIAVLNCVQNKILRDVGKVIIYFIDTIIYISTTLATYPCNIYIYMNIYHT